MAPPRTQRRGLLRALCSLCCAGAARAAASGSEAEEATTFLPAPPFGPQANGGFFEKERRIAPAAGRQPHLVFILLDDWGWGNAGWNNPSCAHVTPTLDGMVKDGIELSHHYVFKYCSPTRSAIQSGRAPYHVNVLNAAPDVWEPANPAAGAAGMAREMTGMGIKMAAANYSTHFFGKWDVGMATLDHTPHGRGYGTGLFYFHHENDYWDSHVPTGSNISTPLRPIFLDLWRTNLGPEGRMPPHTQGPAFGYNNTCPSDPVRFAECATEGHCTVLGQFADHDYGGYEDALLAREVMRTVAEHDPADPYYLFWAPHIAHVPLEVPTEYYVRFDNLPDGDTANHARQIYEAMTNFADTMVGNLTAALKGKEQGGGRSMYDDTLIVFTSDNGGPISDNGTSGANNWPLKGGKATQWEGGIRVPAFISGGFLPAAVRGTKYSGLVTGWDWYGTFSELAGIDPTDHRAAAAGLPPIDSHSMVPVILGKGRSSRVEVPISTDIQLLPMWGKEDQVVALQGLIQEEADGQMWKLVIGDIGESAYTGPRFPNASTNTCCFGGGMGGKGLGKCPPDDPCPPGGITHCGHGCLYRLDTDELETTDLAASEPARLRMMQGRLNELASTAFLPARCACDDGYGGIRCMTGGKACRDNRSVAMALGPYRGWWGPFADLPPLRSDDDVAARFAARDRAEPHATFGPLSQEELEGQPLSPGLGAAWATARAAVPPRAPLPRSRRSGAVSVDWRRPRPGAPHGVVTAVKDQGKHGTCWAFSATGVLEGINAMRPGHQLTSLSEQYFIDCCTVDPGKNFSECAGSVHATWTWEIAQGGGGLPTEASYPYNGSIGACRAASATISKAHMANYSRVIQSASGDQSDILTALETGGPATIGIDGGCIQGYRGGVISNCTGKGVDHAVLLVGAGTDAAGLDYWLVKNSWGDKFGEGGYFRFERDRPLLAFTDAWFGIY